MYMGSGPIRGARARARAPRAACNGTPAFPRRTHGASESALLVLRRTVPDRPVSIGEPGEACPFTNRCYYLVRSSGI